MAGVMDTALEFTGTFISVIIFLITLLCLYIYGQWNNDYWLARQIRGPKPLPYFGNILDFRHRGMNHTLIHWIKEYGRVFGIYILRQPVLVVSDPDMLKEVMVKQFNNFTDKFTMTDRKANHPLVSKLLPFARGAEWKRMRSIINPAFSSAKLKSMETYINDCSLRLLKKLTEYGESNVDTKDVYGAFSLDVISEILFGFGLDTMTEETSPVLTHAKTILDNTLSSKISFVLAGMFPILRKPLRLLGITPLPTKHIEFFIESSNQILQHRKAHPNNRVDFLQLLINAETEDPSYEQAKRLSNFEIQAQLALFFLAGYETTAKTLQFLSHSLATHPSVQEKLCEEIDACIPQGENVTDNLHQLKYMDAVIAETLRLYPPIPYLNRQALADCEILGLKIQAGTAILIPAFAIGRDPEFYSDPEVFRPERFELEEASTSSMTYLPFGAGPRHCVGARLALKEIKMALVHILRNLNFTDSSGVQWPKTVNPTFLQTQNAMSVKISPRHDKQTDC